MNIAGMNSNGAPSMPAASQPGSGSSQDPRIQALEQKLKMLTREKKEALNAHDEKKAQELEKKIQELKKQIEELKAKEKKENDTQGNMDRKPPSDHSLDYLI